MSSMVGLFIGVCLILDRIKEFLVVGRNLRLDESDFLRVQVIPLVEGGIRPFSVKRDFGNETIYVTCCVLCRFTKRNEKAHKSCPKVNSISLCTHLVIKMTGYEICFCTSSSRLCNNWFAQEFCFDSCTGSLYSSHQHFPSIDQVRICCYQVTGNPTDLLRAIDFNWIGYFIGSGLSMEKGP